MTRDVTSFSKSQDQGECAVWCCGARAACGARVRARHQACAVLLRRLASCGHVAHGVRVWAVKHC
jgi:hypothetical protein